MIIRSTHLILLQNPPCALLAWMKIFFQIS